MAPMASGRNGSNDLEAVHPPHAHDFDARRQRAFQLLLLAQPRTVGPRVRRIGPALVKPSRVIKAAWGGLTCSLASATICAAGVEA
jgi:hypothetical protein